MKISDRHKDVARLIHVLSQKDATRNLTSLEKPDIVKKFLIQNKLVVKLSNGKATFIL